MKDRCKSWMTENDDRSVVLIEVERERHQDTEMVAVNESYPTYFSVAKMLPLMPEYCCN